MRADARAAVAAALLILPTLAARAAGDTETQGVNMIAVVTFIVFVAISLLITWWAATRTRDTRHFYAAGHSITPLQNGLAIAGDTISASTLLGFVGLVFVGGFDVAVYILSALSGLVVLLALIAEPFRNMGRYTFSDVAAYRLNPRPIRALSAVSSLVVIVLYLVAQMVAAGALVQLLFNLKYLHAVLIIGSLMTIYVAAGGMLATTWVQIVKAVLLIFAVLVLAFGTLWHFDFSLERMYAQAAAAHPLGTDVLAPGGLLKGAYATLSLAVALFFGTVGLPHVLMRLFTVPDAQAAYRSIFYSSMFVGLVFMIVFFILGFGAISLLYAHPDLFDAHGRLIGGSNMVTVHLSRIVAGDVFLGFISGVVFATILAVVAGLSITGAATLSHDLYANVFRGGEVSEQEELRVSRVTAVVLGVVSILLAILFERQNIAYMISLVFVVTASANCPILFGVLFWRGLTTRGALIGGATGLVLAVSLVVLGPTVWVEILHNPEPVFPSKYPGLISVTAGFIFMWLGSVLDRSEQGQRDRARFAGFYKEIHTATAK